MGCKLGSEHMRHCILRGNKCIRPELIRGEPVFMHCERHINEYEEMWKSLKQGEPTTLTIVLEITSRMKDLEAKYEV